MFGIDPVLLDVVQKIFGILGGAATLAAALRAWILSGRANNNAAAAAASSQRAADQTAGAAVNTASTNDTVTEVKTSLGAFKDRFDEVYGALIEERLQETRMRRMEDQQAEVLRNQQTILEFMAEHETEQHRAQRAAFTDPLFTEQEPPHGYFRPAGD